MAGLNVPKWLSVDDMDTFSRERMAGYLDLNDIFSNTGRVDYLPEEVFPSDHFFCMVGTNRSDYEVAMGISRTFAGHGSDGLVKIENASVWGIDKTGGVKPCPTAYAYRSHSGYFGIVNSEEAYQNLTRFLFGDVRVDVYIEVEEVRLPDELQGTPPDKVDALYQFEVLAAPRGKRWFLTRRVSEEDSVACRSHKDLLSGNKEIYVSSIFLSKSARVDKSRASLAYLLTLGVRVPDYEVERKLWLDKHFEGGYLFHDSVIVEIVPPENVGDSWQVCYGWQSENNVQATTPVVPTPTADGRILIVVPYDGNKSPGIKGSLKFLVSGWN